MRNLGNSVKKVFSATIKYILLNVYMYFIYSFINFCCCLFYVVYPLAILIYRVCASQASSNFNTLAGTLVAAIHLDCFRMLFT